MSDLRLLLVALASSAFVGCAHGGHHPRAMTDDGSPLARVAAIHGGAGPFAVAGYRMGARALTVLGRARGDFELEVVHETPRQVQWSCIADGLQAATGTSAGKLNLRVIELDEERTTSIVRDRQSGRGIRFRLTPSFLERWRDLPRERLPEAGRMVMNLEDDEIFVAELL